MLSVIRRNGKYTAPFASEKETHGHLSGSESTTLMSRFGEPVFSMGFVQCSSALIKNRQNGVITLIHQSLWSDSASVALGLQRMDDIDVITISDQSHGVNMKKIMDTHGIGFRELGHMVNPALERSKIIGGVKLEKSEILGLSVQDLAAMYSNVQREQAVGRVRQVCDIRIPLDGRDGWDLLYRPKENIIWVYEPNAKKLYKFKGF